MAATGTTTGLMHRSKLLYSIISSARASNVGGTSKRSARAVLRLITSSNLIACIAGRSAGFAPLRNATGVGSDLAKGISEVGSVAHQPAGFDKSAARDWACSVRMAPVLDRQAAALLDHDVMWRDRG
jgi:hypothetical protein